jgi:hypothetical protein
MVAVAAAAVATPTTTTTTTTTASTNIAAIRFCDLWSEETIEISQERHNLIVSPMDRSIHLSVNLSIGGSQRSFERSFD